MDPISLLFALLLLILPQNFNPSIILEKSLAEPIYNIKTSTQSENFFPTQAKPKDKYTIVLLGDSMTSELDDQLKNDLEEYYPDKEISVFNYGVGSTPIDTLAHTLTEGLVKGDVTLFPALSKDPDVILIESFANNPLNMPVEDGLRKASEVLDESLKIVRERKPETVIVFFTTIGPSFTNYGQGILNLSAQDRKKAAEDRVRYLENHINYAKAHKIPLINIYEKSKGESGEVKPELVRETDYIHPSRKGFEFINNEIAKFIFDRRVLPL